MFFKSSPSDDIDKKIKTFERACPFPQGEVERLKGRRRILRHLKKDGVGAEIGVFRGHFSELICEVAQPRKFYLIDPWTKNGSTFGWGKEYTNFGSLATADARDEAVLRARRAGGKEIVVIEDSFPACSDKITDKLDWAYVDASHKYDATLNELRKLQAHLKDDAIIAGDDFAISPDQQHHGVFLAVHAFVRESEWNLIDCGIAAQWALKRY